MVKNGWTNCRKLWHQFFLGWYRFGWIRMDRDFCNLCVVTIGDDATSLSVSKKEPQRGGGPGKIPENEGKQKKTEILEKAMNNLKTSWGWELTSTFIYRVLYACKRWLFGIYEPSTVWYPPLKLTAKSPRMDDWKTSFLLGRHIFRCELLVSGRVTSM